jgi:hypothetical protein
VPPTLDNGPRWPARPTLYRGIQMRSRLEAKAAAWLDRCSKPWQYEPVCFADERGEYLPDFVTTMPSGRSRYWEVKGWVPDASPVRARMEIVVSSDPDAVLVLDVLAGDRGSWFYDAHRPDPGWRPLAVTAALER